MCPVFVLVFWVADQMLPISYKCTLPKTLCRLTEGTCTPPPPPPLQCTLETCPYLHNAPRIFVDLSYSALMAWYFLTGSNFAPFEEVKVPVSNSTDFFQKKCPLDDLGNPCVTNDNFCCSNWFTWLMSKYSNWETLLSRLKPYSPNEGIP